MVDDFKLDRELENLFCVVRFLATVSVGVYLDVSSSSCCCLLVHVLVLVGFVCSSRSCPVWAVRYVCSTLHFLEWTPHINTSSHINNTDETNTSSHIINNIQSYPPLIVFSIVLIIAMY